MKILIIGSNGMLARDAIKTLQTVHDLALCDHPDIDILPCRFGHAVSGTISARLGAELRGLY